MAQRRRPRVPVLLAVLAPLSCGYPRSFQPHSVFGAVALMPAIRGLLITGQLAAGKTTLLRTLAEDHGFQVPITTTTRAIDESDFGLRRLPRSKFLAAAQAGRLRLPMVAGSHYYAWDEGALSLLAGGERVAVSVRPYTALTLAALLPGLLPLWLDVDPIERERRLSMRFEERDRNPKDALLRSNFDRDDGAYAQLIPTHLPGVKDSVLRVVSLYEHG